MLVVYVYFLVCVIYSLKPFHSGLLGVGSWYSSPVPTAPPPTSSQKPLPFSPDTPDLPITPNATAKAYSPHGALRGPRKHSPPESTLGPEPSTASWTLTRAPISGKDLPREDGTEMKERGGGKEGEKGRRNGEEERGYKCYCFEVLPTHLPPPPPPPP